MQERDFYDITRAYLRRAHADAVVRAEVFIAPQGASPNAACRSPR